MILKNKNLEFDSSGCKSFMLLIGSFYYPSNIQLGYLSNTLKM